MLKEPRGLPELGLEMDWDWQGIEPATATVWLMLDLLDMGIVDRVVHSGDSVYSGSLESFMRAIGDGASLRFRSLDGVPREARLSSEPGFAAIEAALAVAQSSTLEHAVLLMRLQEDCVSRSLPASARPMVAASHRKVLGVLVRECIRLGVPRIADRGGFRGHPRMVAS